jgi:hypothetical protein
MLKLLANPRLVHDAEPSAAGVLGVVLNVPGIVAPPAPEVVHICSDPLLGT